MIGLKNTIRCRSHKLLGWPRLPFLSERNDPTLRDSITALLKDYYDNNVRTRPLLVGKTSNLIIQANPRYIESMFYHPEIHDEDFIIFGAFKESNNLILDVGANWGFSVRSMRSVGALCKIVSFEPVHYYERCLQRIFDLNLGYYDYHMVGLGESESTIKLVAPVINRIPVFGLATGVEAPEIEVFVKNIHNHIQKYLPILKDIYVQLLELEIQIDTLDNQIKKDLCRFDWNDIAAIKLDIEGMEFPALKGGVNTLKKYKPLIMLEGGNRPEGVSEFMKELDYRYAERQENMLVFKEGSGVAVNGFFIHSDKIESYRELGILN